MGKAKNKNRTLSKSDKVYAKKARNKLKKQNVQRTGVKDLLKKVAATNKNKITGLKATESRRAFRKRLAKFNAERLKERKGPNKEKQKTEASEDEEAAPTRPSSKPKNATYDALKHEYEALQRRVEAGVPTHVKQFNAMLSMCASIGEYHLAVYLVGQMAVQDLEPNEESYQHLQLLQQKTPTNQTHIQGLDLGNALNGLHPKVVLKKLLQKRSVETKWTELKDEVAKVKHWLVRNVDDVNEKNIPNRFKLASLIASSCEISSRKAREVVSGLQRLGFLRQTKEKRELGEDTTKKQKAKNVWVVKKKMMQ